MFQKPRGTSDWIGQNLKEFNYVVEKLKKIATKYSFNQINTPTFESLELFIKNIGESTDVVKKEIYDFYDKSGRRMALRPEGTASVIRAYVENKLYGNQNNVLKLFYIMNVFRYDRPQSGRYREFNQFGVEYLGTNSYLDTIECIMLANSILKEFGIKAYKLKINNLGSFETREKWIKELKIYFSQYKDELTSDSIERIDINPLRILDDKVDSQKEFVKNAPKLEKYLSDEEKEEFQKIINTLKEMDIQLEIDNSLVRGLDYYTKTVFEFVSTSESLGKSTIIGGGNYSNLIKEIGGPNFEGLGFGLGIERLIVALKDDNLFPNFIITNRILIGLDDEKLATKAMKLAIKLRDNNLYVDFLTNEFKKSKIAKYAKSNNFSFILWITKGYIESNILIKENVETGEKTKITLEQLIKQGAK